MKPPKKKCRLYTMEDYGKGIPVTKSDVKPPKTMVCNKGKECWKIAKEHCYHMHRHKINEACEFYCLEMRATCVPVKKGRAKK